MGIYNGLSLHIGGKGRGMGVRGMGEGEGEMGKRFYRMGAKLSIWF